MSNFTINRRRNWLARFSLCESEDSPPIGARTVVQRMSSYDLVFSPGTGVSLQDDYIVLLLPGTKLVAGSGFGVASITIRKGIDPFVTPTRAIASSILNVPQGRFATVFRQAPETAAATTVVDDEVRVVFPFGTTASLGRQDFYRYEVFLSNTSLTSGIVTVYVPSEEADDDDEPPDSPITVCNFSASAV